MSYQYLTTTAAADHRRHRAEAAATRSRAIRETRTADMTSTSSATRATAVRTGSPLASLSGVLRRMAWGASPSSATPPAATAAR